ncbi:MAG: hypothetical protein P1S60_10005, partial [Anaerolineae bacterium]|nr:hypothetical protein [Anaerolineae bacterium]
MTQPQFTSKERVLMTFKHQIPDRVPINYSANPGIDQRLKAFYGLSQDDHEGLRQQLGIDFRSLNVPYIGPRLYPESTDPLIRISPDWGMQLHYIEHGSGAYWEPWGEPLRDMDLETARTLPMPSPDDYDYSVISPFCERYHDFATSTHPGFEVMNWTGRFVGHERMYIGLATDDPALWTFIHRFIDIKYEILRRILAVAAGRLAFLGIGEDLGTQRGPRISLALFRSRIRPIHQRFIDLAKTHQLPIMIHSCGSSSWAFPDFIDMGIDAVDTLQPEAALMSPAYLKNSFGDQLAFHGCISTAGPVA